MAETTEKRAPNAVETTSIPATAPAPEIPRPHLPPLLHQARRLALRRNRMGAPHRPDHRRPGRRDLRAERRRGPQRLVDDRHQHRGLQIPARHSRHSRARNRRPPARQPRRRNHSRLGSRRRVTSELPKTVPPSTTSSRTSLSASTPPSIRPSGSTWAAIASSPTPTPSNWHWNPVSRPRRVRRHRLQHAAMLGLLHQLGERFARFHPHSGQDRRHALQVGIRHRHQSLSAALLHRRPQRRRHRQRPTQLHERLRRLRRRHQVRRQNSPRRQDGHPQRRPSRHHRLHRVQVRKKKPRPTRWSPWDTTARIPTPTPTPPSSSRTPTTPFA